MALGALEGAGAVAEAALLRGQLDDLGRLAVVGAHRDDRLGDLLSVCTDVLDRRRPGRAGDSRQALDPGQAVGDAASHELVPGLARGDGEPHPLAVVDARRAEAAGGDAHDGALESRIGDHQVGAAGDQQQRLAARVGGGNRLDQLGGARRLEQTSRRATELQRGQLGEWDVVALLHEASIPGRRPPRASAAPPAPVPALLRRPVWRVPDRRPARPPSLRERSARAS